MTDKPSVVFFGNERIATGLDKTNLPTLNKLVENGYKIDAIFSPSKKATSRNEHSFEVFEFAKKHNISIHTDYSQSELQNILNNLPAQVGILVAYGKIVPQSVIDNFKYGIINIHPSLLPKYRGSTPIETAILDGVNVTGVSIMQLSSQMDAGPVFAQEKIHLEDNVSKQHLADKLNSIGANLLVNNLEQIINNNLKPKPQKGDIIECKKISKNDGVIDTNDDADLVLRKIRAYSGWPKSHLLFNDKDIIILSAKPSNIRTKLNNISINEGKLILKCNNSSVEITSLQQPGKKPMDAKSFINGYKNFIS
jgi:methionyl-tRNA formyltransferase